MPKSKIVIATLREKRALKGADQIGLRVGRVLHAKGVGKYFNISIVEWHMRKALAPLLFDDERVTEEPSEKSSVVPPSQRSKKAPALVGD